MRTRRTAPGGVDPAVERFPDANPNPVIRLAADGTVTYANAASTAILDALAVGVGGRVGRAIAARLDAAAATGGFVDVVAGHRTYAVWPVPVPELGFTNLYGTDVTAERAIRRFPDQNPNPVLRIDPQGVLLYANPASRHLVSGLGLTIGGSLPGDLGTRLLDLARDPESSSIELEGGGRTYLLLPVDVPEFGFVNVYGTDVTAAKERERLARENERLLLNILPEQIADRLRSGEALIADRFDDVTLLFADIVDFTRLSSRMSPSELVEVLNDVFSAFDGLVDVYALEKVKTIGDAYMVVGGLPEPSTDHASRLAAMALELVDVVSRVEAASRAGIRFRIGMHSGPVVAGVIGKRKFIYDIWGDTVNTASRMESLGVPGRIQVTEAVRDRLRDGFVFEPRGVIDVKGKGPMPTYFLTGRSGLARAWATS